MKYSPLLLLLLLAACAEPPNPLVGKPKTLVLQAVTWGCDCANWATPADIHRFYDSGDSLAARCYFVEPAGHKLILPDTLGYNGDVIRFTGQFYREPAFPKGFDSKEPVNKALVFRYTQFKIIKSTYREARQDKALRKAGGGKVFYQQPAQ